MWICHILSWVCSSVYRQNFSSSETDHHQQLIIASSGRKCSWLHFCEVWLIGAKKPQVEVVIWSWPGNRLLYLVQLVSEELPRTTFISIRAKHLLACLLYHSYLFPSSSSRYARLSGTPKSGIKHSPHSCSSCKCRMNVKSIVFRVSVAKNPARITVKDNLDTQSSWDDDRSAYFQF